MMDESDRNALDNNNNNIYLVANECWLMVF